MYHETQDLDTWMSEVDRRLCALEQTRTSNKTAGSAITAPESSPRTFWALEELQRQRQTEKPIADGAARECRASACRDVCADAGAGVLWPPDLR